MTDHENLLRRVLQFVKNLAYLDCKCFMASVIFYLKVLVRSKILRKQNLFFFAAFFLKKMPNYT